MSSTAPQIFRWREQVKADRRLRPIDFLVAFQLSEKTSTREFGKSGNLITWQGLASMAAAIGVSEQTVRRSIKRLKKYRHLNVDPGGGRYHSNRYTLLLRPAVQAVEGAKNKVETLSTVTPFPGNPISGDRVSPETLSTVTGNPINGDRKPYQACHPNPSIRDLSNPSADHRETEPGGPRRALRALGPLGELEGELRQRLGGRFDLLSMARVLPSDDDIVRLSVLTPYQRDQIKLRCEADILAAAGASQIEYVVELASTAFMEKAR